MRCSAHLRPAVQAAVVLDDDAGKVFGARKATLVRSDIRNMAVAELQVGDCFGEMSVMYRNKCVANVKAVAPLEVRPRHTLRAMLAAHERGVRDYCRCVSVAHLWGSPSHRVVVPAR